jgi:hypothetical protein
MLRRLLTSALVRDAALLSALPAMADGHLPGPPGGTSFVVVAASALVDTGSRFV